jgi:hypothetical protein
VTTDGTVASATLTASGIARLANVGRAAVSNWRRRYADFPIPVGGTANSPTFDAAAVERWLHQQGRLREAGIEQLAWRQIERYQPATAIGDALAIGGAYLLACTIRPPRRGALLTPQQLRTRLRALDPNLAALLGDVLPADWTPQLTAVVQAIQQLVGERDPETAFEYLHSQYVSAPQAMSGLAGTPDVVAELMLTLTGTGQRTLDFTSGTGSLLRMAADRALQQGHPTRCYAQEIKQQYALITLLRLWFVQQRGTLTAPPDVHVGDSLLADAFPDLRADVVVANFPFGIHDWGHERLAYDPRWIYGLPPRTEPELAWVQHALAHLAADGTAAVLMPPAAAARPAGRRIRAELVRRGALRAIIALPPGLMPPISLGLHIWVLTQPDQAPAGRLLLVDTTDVELGALSRVAGNAWQTYLAGNDTTTPGVHRSIPAIDVLDNHVDLTPRRYLPQAEEVAADPTRTIEKITEFSQRLEHLRASLPVVQTVESTALSNAPQASLASLIQAGSISVQRAATRGTANSQPVQANDILIPVTGRHLIARVASTSQVGAEPEANTQIVRVDQTQFDPWFVAGILSRTDNQRITGRSSASSALGRIDLRRISLPVLPIEQQRVYGEAFRRLAEFRATLDEVTAVGEAIARAVGDGLATGSLDAQ